ncbi:MAG: hypothetical protein LBE62_06165 [Azonexus sp.]|jgi:hypothetical protein|nr:hypothetical protein [Azonexus sp.]
MSFKFDATETGFSDGLGGASNSAGADDYHYIVFGRQIDSQHPENSGAYFEFDDQANGGINIVKKIVIIDDNVVFMLIDSSIIQVFCKTDRNSWQDFLCGIDESFDSEIIHA